MAAYRARVAGLFLWWGPRLSIAPLIADFLRVTASSAELGAEYAQAIDQARQTLTLLGGQLNLMGLLAAGFLGVPSLLSITALGIDFLPAVPPTFQCPAWWWRSRLSCS